MRRLCVFAGSSCGADPRYAAGARELGQALAARGIGVVFGGGRVGLMGVLADAALAAGGEVIGVLPRALATAELAHTGLADLRIVGSMHERKALMAELADGFVALPGGYGTFEELFEAITWSQLGLHAKPIGVLDVAGYYRALSALIEHAVAERFVRAEHRALVVGAESVDALLDRLVAFRPPAGVRKWITPAEA
ncbi:MAG: TIGR00730 family Rossman fold protein [Candidatus Binatia bacterium]